MYIQCIPWPWLYHPSPVPIFIAVSIFGPPSVDSWLAWLSAPAPVPPDLLRLTVIGSVQHGYIQRGDGSSASLPKINNATNTLTNSVKKPKNTNKCQLFTALSPFCEWTAKWEKGECQDICASITTKCCKSLYFLSLAFTNNPKLMHSMYLQYLPRNDIAAKNLLLQVRKRCHLDHFCQVTLHHGKDV